jgi:hypothetical protein
VHPTPIKGGVQAKATITTKGGMLSAPMLTTSGSGYVTAPTVTVVSIDPNTREPTGTGAVVKVEITDGKVTGLKLESGGTGYAEATLVIESPVEKTQRYAITARFVEKHMSFAENSFVFLNACSSAADDGAMREACFKKGASIYAGWDAIGLADEMSRAGSFFFDRLLAANQYEPESPKQRPFDYRAIHRDMAKRGITKSSHPFIKEALRVP